MTTESIDWVKARVKAVSRSIELGAPVDGSLWPKHLFNRETKRFYKPHNEAEREFIYTDFPRRVLLKGGEGSGKSTAGAIKTLGRLRRGMNGVMVSTDFPHLRKSLWPEFRNWVPPQVIVPSQVRCLSPTWDPGAFFTLHFFNELGGISSLYIGGIEDPFGWRGPNINFAHFDEAERHSHPDALKVLDGRIRIPGPNGEPCQLWLTTTPRKHWLYDYFGGIEPGELPRMEEDDPNADFKSNARTITLRTIENEENLEPGYVKTRTAGLPAAEARVLMDAQWEDLSDSDPFIPNMIVWDNCKEDKIPDPTIHDYLVVAIDAATAHDSFGLAAVSPHPLRRGLVAVQAAHEWNPKTVAKRYLLADGSLDFEQIENDIRNLIRGWNVVKLVYDPHELHYMASRLSDVVYTEKFSQNDQRALADKQLLDMILSRKIAHRGEPDLRKHIFNANRKPTGDRGMRIVKRESGLKIDIAVSLSMAVYAVMEYVPAVEGYVATGTSAPGTSVLDQLHSLISEANN